MKKDVSRRRVLLVIFTLILVAPSVLALRSASGLVAPPTTLVARRNFFMRIFADIGELNTSRRRLLASSSTNEELTQRYAQIRSEILKTVPINGKRSYGYLKAICAMGSRVSGTPGMLKQQQWITKHCRQLGGQVSRQTFRVRHPETGQSVEMANLIVRWFPQKKKRIILCAHYDTRPYPDEDPDPRRRRGLFVGANDGASGVALLAELAHHMKTIEKIPYGVEFVFLDCEEFIFDKDRDEYFLGSKYFAREYVRQPPAYQYVAAVLFDMIGDEHLQIFREKNSVKYANVMVRDIWRIAAELKVKEFKQGAARHEVRDDHLPLNRIARIPAIDLIDFDYPSPDVPLQRQYWHTQFDTADKCSDMSLARVGWVMMTWLKRLQ